MMHLIAIRHGETNANASGLIQSDLLDEPLNEKGHEQIVACLAQLVDLKPSALYSTGFLRTDQSAEIIGNHFSLQYAVCPELQELGFGSLAGLAFAEAARRLGHTSEIEFKEQLQRLEFDFTPYGGESAHQARERLLRVLRWLYKRHRGQVVIVVMHGAMIRQLCYIDGRSLEPWYPNGSVHRFDITDQHIAATV